MYFIVLMNQKLTFLNFYLDNIISTSCKKKICILPQGHMTLFKWYNNLNN